MGTTAICFVISLVLGFFYALKKSRKDELFDMLDWLRNIFIFGVGSLLLGFLISINVGNYISGEFVLTKTRALEPVVVGGKEVFLIKKGPSYYYFCYFTGGKQHGGILEMNSTIKKADFDGVREERKYEKVFKTPKLHWFFFKEFGYTEIVVSSQEDIL